MSTSTMHVQLRLEVASVYISKLTAFVKCRCCVLFLLDLCFPLYVNLLGRQPLSCCRLTMYVDSSSDPRNCCMFTRACMTLLHAILRPSRSNSVPASEVTKDSATCQLEPELECAVMKGIDGYRGCLYGVRCCSIHEQQSVHKYAVPAGLEEHRSLRWLVPFVQSIKGKPTAAAADCKYGATELAL